MIYERRSTLWSKNLARIFLFFSTHGGRDALRIVDANIRATSGTIKLPHAGVVVGLQLDETLKIHYDER